MLHRNIDNLLVTHSAILEVELVIGKHEARVVSLCTLDSPWWIYMDYFEVADLLHKVFEVEESKVTVNESLRTEFFVGLFLVLLL